MDLVEALARRGPKPPISTITGPRNGFLKIQNSAAFEFGALATKQTGTKGKRVCSKSTTSLLRCLGRLRTHLIFVEARLEECPNAPSDLPYSLQTKIVFIAHSMGGLVVKKVCHVSVATHAHSHSGRLIF